MTPTEAGYYWMIEKKTGRKMIVEVGGSPDLYVCTFERTEWKLKDLEQIPQPFVGWEWGPRVVYPKKAPRFLFRDSSGMTILERYRLAFQDLSPVKKALAEIYLLLETASLNLPTENTPIDYVPGELGFAASYAKIALLHLVKGRTAIGDHLDSSQFTKELAPSPYQKELSRE